MSSEFVNFNLVPNNGLLNNISPTFLSASTSGSAISSVTVFGLAMLIIYSLTKILNFYSNFQFNFPFLTVLFIIFNLIDSSNSNRLCGNSVKDFKSLT